MGFLFSTTKVIKIPWSAWPIKPLALPERGKLNGPGPTRSWAPTRSQQSKYFTDSAACVLGDWGQNSKQKSQRLLSEQVPFRCDAVKSVSTTNQSNPTDRWPWTTKVHGAHGNNLKLVNSDFP